jgi:hypothetical protein
VEEIPSRFVEIELDCENGGLWYRVITYYKDGSSATDLKCLGNVKENMGDILESLGSNELETMIEEILVEEQKEK